jgi:hypothetical protein
VAYGSKGLFFGIRVDYVRCPFGLDCLCSDKRLVAEKRITFEYTDRHWQKQQRYFDEGTGAAAE